MNHGARIHESRDAARERTEQDEQERYEAQRMAAVRASYSYARDPVGDLLWDYFEGQLELAGAVLVWLAPLGAEQRMVACVSTHCQGARRFDQRGAPQLTAAPHCPYCDRIASACWTLPCLALSEILSEGYESTNSWLEATDAPFRVGVGN